MKYIFLFIYLFCLLSCDTEQKIEVPQKLGYIVLTVNKPETENIFYFTSELWLKNEKLFSVYYDNTLATTNFNSNDFLTTKQITIPLMDEYAMIRHQTNAINYFDYLIKKGDTLEITYSNKIPIFKIKNRITKNKDLNIEEYISKLIIKEKTLPTCKYFDYNYTYLEKIYSDTKLLSKIKNLDIENNMKVKFEIENSIKLDLNSSVRKFNKLFIYKLDSLFNKNEISEDIHDFYKNKYEVIEKILLIENNNLDDDALKNIFYKINPNYNNYNYFHQLLIESYIRKYIRPKAKFLDLKDGTNKDNRDVFKFIEDNQLLRNEDKKQFLASELNKIGQNFSKAEFLSHFKRFSEYTKDTILISIIKNSFYTYFDKDSDVSNSALLSDNFNNKFNLTNVLTSQKNKLIYIDFWASWCAPCIEEFKSSAKLQKEVANLPISFIYVSIDKNKISWEKAYTKENLKDKPNNFLFVNYENSNFSQLHKLTSIPRYMIFDNKGNLAFTDAPRPSDPKLRQIFDELLKKQ
jgi:thiol-disulfide isomerase/thioredoxin